MNLITTTELRTKTKNLVEALISGREVKLVHRSKVIGTFKPSRNTGKKFNANKVAKILKSLNPKKISYKIAMENYKKHIDEKYGKGIS